MPDLLSAVAGSSLPPATRVWIGSYGASRTALDLAHRSSAAYAPMFTFVRNKTWDARSAANAANPGLAGAIPTMPQLLRLAPVDRAAWGRELGKRMRDDMRRAGACDGWQLDEIMPVSTDPTWGAAARELEAATLEGLHEGRPELGDLPLRGMVWFAHSALALASRPSDPDLVRFFETIEKTCDLVIGEEYPPFTGDPVAAAAKNGKWRADLAAQPDVRARLARIAIPGLTPGVHLGTSLGGNVSALPGTKVDAWRDGYVAARASTRPIGFAEYLWRFENATPQVEDATIAAIASAMR